MSDLSLHDLSKKMAKLDFTMMATRSSNGTLTARPMSNNGDVSYDGNSYYFTYEEALTVRDIESDANVALGFARKSGIFVSNGLYIAVEGKAELIRDKAAFKAHWTSDLDVWFEQGVDTPNLVLIKVHATRIKYWDGEDQGEITL